MGSLSAAALLLAITIQCHGLSNPMAALMAKENSKATRDFASHVITTFGDHATRVGIGMPATYDEFRNDVANITSSFLLLPLPDQRRILAAYRTKLVDEQLRSSVRHIPELERRINSPAARDTLDQINRQYSFVKETDKAIEALKEADPELAMIVERVVREGKEQYELIKSQAGKDCVRNTLLYLDDKRLQKELTDEDFTHLKAGFAKLSAAERIDVVRRVTWLLNPAYKYVYNVLISSAGLDVLKKF